jgi:hypothetical protein
LTGQNEPFGRLLLQAIEGCVSVAGLIEIAGEETVGVNCIFAKGQKIAGRTAAR